MRVGPAVPARVGRVESLRRGGRRVWGTGKGKCEMTSITGAWGSVLDVMEQPAWAVDADHAVCYANPAAARKLGHSRPGDLLGRDGRPLTASSGEPQQRTEPAEPDDQAGSGRGEGMLVRADGSLLLVEWTAVPLDGPDGDTTLYVFRPLPDPADRGAGDESPPYRLLEHRQAERRRHYAETLQHVVQERLVRALLGLSLARQELGDVPSRALDLLHDAARDTEEALAGVREVTNALSPGALRVGGLPAAFAALARRCPVPMGVSGTLAERLPRLVETHVYLLVAEAVERAVEHGRAGRVEVRADAGTNLTVTVLDNGVPPTGAADAAALSALAQRAATLHGTLTVTHTPGTGTELTAVVPL